MHIVNVNISYKASYYREGSALHSQKKSTSPTPMKNERGKTIKKQLSIKNNSPHQKS